MKNTTRPLLLALGLLCAATPACSTTEPATQSATDALVLPRGNDPINWEHLEPSAFLDALCAQPERHFISVWNRAPADWIRPEHVPALLQRSLSTTPCAGVVSAESSMLPTHGSTEGREALYLIEALRTGRAYPPGLSSIDYFDPDPSGAHSWWLATGDPGRAGGSGTGRGQ